MTPNELRKYFPNASASTAKRNQAESDWNRTPNLVQDAKDGGAGQPNRKAAPNDRPKVKAVDGEMHQKFGVTIIVRVSDNRRRDLDGCASSILDCLVSARRLLAGYTGTNDPDGAS